MIATLLFAAVTMNWFRVRNRWWETLLLGLAVADNSDPAEGAKTNAASPAKSGVSAGRSNTAPRWFGHLRERLKLW